MPSTSKMWPHVPIVSDETLALIDQGETPPPSGWASRALYRGQAGANNWLAVVEEPNYPLGHPDHLGVSSKRHDAVDGLDIGTLVSLGAGDGISDLELLSAISGDGSGTGRRIRYIPVDISRVLLETAIAAVHPHHEIPVAVHGDFEEQQGLLADVLNRWASPPLLIALLGGTVGNLDNGELPFFEGLRRLMRVEDAFLVDIPLAGPAWNVEDEPRLKPGGYTSVFRRFLGAGLEWPSLVADARMSAATAGGQHPFEEQVSFSLTHDDDTCAEVITVCNRGDARPVLRFRRYRWQPILRWFANHGFKVQFSWSSVTSDKDGFGMGVCLLRPR